jgi:hypothetical protein
MKDRISKDGNRIVSTEYEVRYIDAYGDSQDIEHYGRKREAMEAAQRPVGDPIRATVVERHISKRPARLYDQPDVFTTIAVFGDKAALELWGFKPGESTWLEAANFDE